jgi:NAD+ synthase (glutamine-hydrolysing)
MKRALRLAIAQIDTVVGDIAGNTNRILQAMDRAEEAQADLVTFPELALTGYPPEDLLLKPQFVDANLAALNELAAQARDVVAIVGFVDRAGDIFNAAAVIQSGRVVVTYHKMYLPNYGVFDEFRYFRAGRECPVVRIGDATVGVSICEDIWYPDGPYFHQAISGGADVLVNISSSPYHAGKGQWRERMLKTRAVDNTAIVAYTNLVGGQDELVFDGASMVISASGEILARGRQFEEDFIVVDLDIEAVFRQRLREPRHRQQTAEAAAPSRWTLSQTVRNRPPVESHPIELLGKAEEIYRALVLGTRDYVHKNGFQKVVLGLSGGVDSALTACIAVDALGAVNVVGVMMPSEFSSAGSIEDASQLGRNLGIELLTLPIGDVFGAYKKSLAEGFKGAPPNVAEENLQARVRGNFLMALSNKFGWLVLSTGNKSEISTGYCTLYGDMAGGFSVLKDVMKATVYELAEFCNAKGERIPRATIDKPPSAELRPDQLDTDSLPPYPVLDPILKAYVEEDLGLTDIVAMGFDPAVVRQVIRLVDINEYKRRQAAPGIKITPRAFGRDRRMPITNRFR